MTTMAEPKAPSHSSLWASVGVAIGHIVRRLMAWHGQTCERRQLLSLSDRALKDIGRSRRRRLLDAACGLDHGEGRSTRLAR